MILSTIVVCLLVNTDRSFKPFWVRDGAAKLFIMWGSAALCSFLACLIKMLGKRTSKILQIELVLHTLFMHCALVFWKSLLSWKQSYTWGCAKQLVDLGFYLMWEKPAKKSVSHFTKYFPVTPKRQKDCFYSVLLLFYVLLFFQHFYLSDHIFQSCIDQKFVDNY